jgi:5-oxoprolinase (ATP-hydrolysing) subunit A
MKQMPINIDCGENFGNYNMYNDEVIVANADLVNVACGFHAGDYQTICQIIKLAKKYQTKVGAHPSYLDLQGFGRRYMSMTSEELYDLITFQIATIYGLCTRFEVELNHVKPHGALYHTVAYGSASEIFLKAIADFDKTLTIICPPNSDLHILCQKNQVNCMTEAFADRRYNASLKLIDRSKENAVYQDIRDITNQYDQLCQGYVIVDTGSKLALQADTVCIHGDRNNIEQIIKQIKQ